MKETTRDIQVGAVATLVTMAKVMIGTPQVIHFPMQTHRCETTTLMIHGPAQTFSGMKTHKDRPDGSSTAGSLHTALWPAYPSKFDECYATASLE
jgi:hypothetical protein